MTRILIIFLFFTIIITTTYTTCKFFTRIHLFHKKQKKKKKEEKFLSGQESKNHWKFIVHHKLRPQMVELSLVHQFPGNALTLQVSILDIVLIFFFYLIFPCFCNLFFFNKNLNTSVVCDPRMLWMQHILQIPKCQEYFHSCYNIIWKFVKFYKYYTTNSFKVI